MKVLPFIKIFGVIVTINIQITRSKKKIPPVKIQSEGKIQGEQKLFVDVSLEIQILGKGYALDCEFHGQNHKRKHETVQP